ncbi:non-hydrolyzing UDP-N-acetylglucosamine 2-epimerase [Frondihabitans sp. PAMC 28766]|uniref:non-hydrolyzing UDP-N-acetylglucosamine 2-epimerase n=1 Tax=Frondihabitans sp. PAMC 28766 TaxID=1795630 RepID=UPI000B0A1B97
MSGLESRAQHVVVHTGQHYDPALSDVFFDDLGIQAPGHSLNIGSASHGRQTGAMLASLETVFDAEKPDAVLVYGDTNSTLAAALAAVKLGVRLHHLEAGLRSFNRAMPEEHNRVLTDHASDLCLAPTESAMDNLAAEGLSRSSVLVGDVMTDVVLATRDRVRHEALPVPSSLSASPFYLATLHRPSNTDDPARLRAVLEPLARLDHPTLLVAHPRLVDRAASFGIPLDFEGLHSTPAVGYPDLVRLVMGSAGVVTDSGGLQKEAFLLEKPCITVRSETEWTETVDLGWNVLAGDRLAEIPSLMAALRPEPTNATPYGTGTAAVAAVDAILRDLS